MKVSVLVAFRDDSSERFRERLWDFVRARMASEHPDFEIVEASDDGADPFHKTLALNRAAARATGEIFYICDSDTWVPPAQVNAALEGLDDQPLRWWRPWKRKVKLNELDTAKVLALGDSWDGTIPDGWIRSAENRNTYWAAPPLLVHRDVFEGVGGLDERFRGWGQEDDAFAEALKALYGPPKAVQGACVHLWHPRIGKSGRDLWPGQEAFGPNLELAAEYKRAARRPGAMRALISDREGSA